MYRQALGFAHRRAVGRCAVVLLAERGDHALLKFAPGLAYLTLVLRLCKVVAARKEDGAGFLVGCVAAAVL